MRKLLTLIILLIIVLSAIGQTSSNFMIIIDPGHGGSDNGAVLVNKNKKIIFTESDYTYDVSLRLEKILKDSGIFVLKTTKMKEDIITERISLFSASNAVFSIDSTKVHNHKGLYKRTDFCNNLKKYYPNHKIIFISIHLDYIRSDLFGVRIISGVNNESRTLSQFLREGFTNNEMMSNFPWPVLRNNDPDHYQKNLVVLDTVNYVLPKVLIELGNIKNSNDLYRIKDFRNRDLYALIIFNSIINYIEKTDYE